MGKLKHGPIPTSGQLSESEEKHLRLRVKQLTCGSLNGKRSRQFLQQPYKPKECMARMECRDCGAIPRRGLLLTIPRTDSLRGYKGRDYGRKCLWRKASQPWKEGNTVGSCVGGGAITSSVQFSSVAQPCLTLCDPMNRSTPGLPVHHQLPEFTQTHVH